MSTRVIAFVLGVVFWLPTVAQAQLYAIADFMVPTRSISSDAVFQRRQVDGLLGAPEVSDQVALSADDLDLNFVTGGRITIGNRYGEYGFEGSYMVTDKWKAAASIYDGTGMLASPFSQIGKAPDPVVDNNMSATVTYETEMQSAEMHFMHRVYSGACGDATFLYGARAMEIDESLTYLTDNGLVTNDVLTEVDNWLVGPQIGLLTESPLWDGALNLTFKWALMHNQVEKSTVFNGVLGEADCGSAAMLGEFRAEYLFFPTSFMIVRIGYQLIGVTDVALATNNFETGLASLAAGQAHVSTSDTLYQAPYIGIILTH